MNPPECETVHALAFVEVSVMVNRPRRLIDILYRKIPPVPCPVQFSSSLVSALSILYSNGVAARTTTG